MSAKLNDDGGAAFPCFVPGGHTDKFGVGGMSLRDYFAASAMHAIIRTTGEAAIELAKSGQEIPESLGDDFKIAKAAYGAADAMLAERNKTVNQNQI